MRSAAAIYSEFLTPDGRSSREVYRELLDATPDCIKLISCSGHLLMMNKAGCLALGVDPEGGFGMPWLGLLPDDLSPLGQKALALAAQGETARFHGRSALGDGVMYWDNLLTPLFDDRRHVVSILCVSRDVTEITLLELRLKEAIEREKLIAGEMRHRIKNVFSVVSGLIKICEREAAAEGRSAGGQGSVTEILKDKLGSLARASDAVFASEDSDCDEGAVDIGNVIPSILNPYGDRCSLAGEPAWVKQSEITTLALFLHELATNSVKYGALSHATGHVRVTWRSDGACLDLTWTETGGPPISAQPQALGFGTEMVNRVVNAARGTVVRSWHNKGLAVHLNFPALGRPQLHRQV